VLSGTGVDDGLILDLAGGQRIAARRALLATGMQYCPPDLPGLVRCGPFDVPVSVLSRLGDA
jgi:hypothetical protein